MKRERNKISRRQFMQLSSGIATSVALAGTASLYAAQQSHGESIQSAGGYGMGAYGRGTYGEEVVQNSGIAPNTETDTNTLDLFLPIIMDGRK